MVFGYLMKKMYFQYFILLFFCSPACTHHHQMIKILVRTNGSSIVDGHLHPSIKIIFFLKILRVFCAHYYHLANGYLDQ